MGNVQIAVRVPEQDLERLLRELRELDIAEEYRRAYATEPADGEDKGVGIAGLELGAELVRPRTRRGGHYPKCAFCFPLSSCMLLSIVAHVSVSLLR